jgi:hypothetical protein
LRVYAPDSYDTSREAAAAQAAFRVLLDLYPAERATLQETLAETLARIPEGPSKAAGVRLGDTVAESVIVWRRNDGSQRSASHPASTEPGKWRPTPPGFKPALLPQWAGVTPFGIPSASQFRQPYPPDLRSAEYARHFQEVKDLGSATSTVRTREQTEIAHYWADGAGTVTPPGHWNRIAQGVARSSGLSLPENARLFALLNVTLADAAIVCWDMKFACNFWRPVTAIHEADRDGNDQTQPDRAWSPLLTTPPFPSCTSGHSTFSGAAAEALKLFFGRDDVRFTDVSESGRSRTFVSFTQAANEAGRSRIYGGIHYEFDNTTGLESGRAVARSIFQNHAQPLSPAGNAIATREAYRPAIDATAATATFDDSGWRPATGIAAATWPQVTSSLHDGATVAYYPVDAFSATTTAVPVLTPVPSATISQQACTLPVYVPLGAP